MKRLFLTIIGFIFCSQYIMAQFSVEGVMPYLKNRGNNYNPQTDIWGGVWIAVPETDRNTEFNETYMDCPYYEQLQYLGDTRIQALITLFNTGDDTMVRNFLIQSDQSRNAEGCTQARYQPVIRRKVRNGMLR